MKTSTKICGFVLALYTVTCLTALGWHQPNLMGGILTGLLWVFIVVAVLLSFRVSTTNKGDEKDEIDCDLADIRMQTLSQLRDMAKLFDDDSVEIVVDREGFSIKGHLYIFEELTDIPDDNEGKDHLVYLAYTEYVDFEWDEGEDPDDADVVPNDTLTPALKRIEKNSEALRDRMSGAIAAKKLQEASARVDMRFPATVGLSKVGHGPEVG